jgi:hypothetical protein
MVHHDGFKDRVAAARDAIVKVDPGRDQDLFIDHNIRPFVVPGDWTFEPCSHHYDTVGASELIISNCVIMQST